MSGFLTFVLLVSGMGVGTLVCGLLPLSLPLSHRMMRVLEVFGAGLLVGAAVTVVIPEGSSALFARTTPSTEASASAYSGMLHLPSTFQSTAPVQAASARRVYNHAAQEPWAWSFVTKRSVDVSADDHQHSSNGHDAPNDQKPFTQSDAEHRLGSSILFGIVLMYVIDQLTSGAANASSGHSHDKADDNANVHHRQQHHHDYPVAPVRPRLETHRLSKSFHQRDASAAPNTLHKVSSRASFTLFDRSQHGISTTDEEAQISTQHAATHVDPHRRIGSIATASSSSDNDLPADYDDHDAEHYQNADLKRVSSSHGTNDWHGSPRSSMVMNRDTSHHDSPSAVAPLLGRHDSFASGTSGRPRLQRTRSISSAHAPRSTFGQALTTIVGLLIHAAADGIAMGASAQSGDQTLTMIVFVAIMIHKAPAAFGLCAMLMSQRLSRTSIRKAVGVFALASPLGAILTYLALALLLDADLVSAHGGGSSDGSGIDGKSIGTALAFSGGTFLFVAFHAVLELAGADADTVPSQDGSEPGETQILGKWLRVLLLIAGACTPRILQTLLASVGGGAHHH